jgi:hypothetical protein
MLDAECAVKRVQDFYRTNKEPPRTRTITFVEEESCQSVSETGAASIAYRCLSFRAQEWSGRTPTMDLVVDGM